MRGVKAVQISAFRRDAVVKVWCGVSTWKGGKRGTIVEFSDKARGRLLFTAFNARVEWLAFGFLTYPKEFPHDGRKVKRDIHLLCQWLERQLGANYFWAIEFQTRGAVHVNLLVDKFVSKVDLSWRWFEIVGSGDWKHLFAGTRIEYAHSTEQAAGYIAACYSAKKSKQKEVPEGFQNVGRFWGCSRGLVVVEKEAIFLIDEAMPKVRALRKFAEKGIKPRKVQPMKESNLRKRKVRRKPCYWLHGGLQGFKTFRGGKIAKVLIESKGGD
jgi:hypothetical protein